MKNNRYILFGIIVAFFGTRASGQNATGLIFDDQAYSKLPRISPSLKFAEEDVPVFSLKKYCPAPGNQGQMSSCVGWAAGYAASTIAAAVRDSITDRARINNMSRSALYLYNQIYEGSCDKGSLIESSLELMKAKGVCLQTEFNPRDCQVTPGSVEDARASRNKISSYCTLFEWNAGYEEKIRTVRNCIKSGKPVVVGMEIFPSFKSIGSDGIWRPLPEEVKTEGHAMCVIGYSNLTRQFELLNSWGAGFGKNGYCYVSYEDFAKYCKYAFQFTLPSADTDKSFKFNSTFYVKKLTGVDDETGDYVYERLKPVFRQDHYEYAPGQLNEGDYFKVMASDIKADNLLYIFSIKPDGSSELLFPRAARYGASVVELPIITSSKSYVEIPANPAKILKADQSGTDHLVFLFSTKEIGDMEDLASRMEEMDIPIGERLKKVFGDALVPEHEIRYSPSDMSFSGTATSGYIVPLVLEVPVN